MDKKLLYLTIIILISSSIYSYTKQTQHDINIVLIDGYEQQEQHNLELIIEGDDIDEENNCNYDVGDYIVDCSLNCDITTNLDLGANSLILYGNGNFYINANITANKVIIENGCNIINEIGDNNALVVDIQ